MAERDTEAPDEPGKSESRGSRGSPLERPISLAAPLLDLLLWVGDWISRVAGPVDHEHYPVRPPDREDAGGGKGSGQDDR